MRSERGASELTPAAQGSKVTKIIRQSERTCRPRGRGGAAQGIPGLIMARHLDFLALFPCLIASTDGYAS